jgi:hypothetical protein
MVRRRSRSQTIVKQRPADQTTLVSWHHTKIAKIMGALGAHPAAFLPNGQWPDDAFDWVVAPRFDQQGHLIPGASSVIHEPAGVDDVVWLVMSHPNIRLLAQDQRAHGYFGRIGKAMILSDLEAARGAPCAPSWAKMKKGELADLAERQIADSAWLPALLR